MVWGFALQIFSHRSDAEKLMRSTVEHLVTQGRDRLARAPCEISGREARLLLARVLGWTESEVLARSDRLAEERQVERYRELIDRRATGEPVAYILGVKEFYGHDFEVDKRVLIPRPETEHVVEEALRLFPAGGGTILDIGTGSACIAVSLSLERPLARVIATDSAPGALAVARSNLRRHGVESRVQLVRTDLTGGIDLRAIDLVVSNPPYVGRQARDELSCEILDFEPDEALFGGADGSELIQRLLLQLRSLRSGVRVVLEIGFDQQDTVARLASDSGFAETRILLDYAGKPRVALIRQS